jgi:hypothetical protein
MSGFVLKTGCDKINLNVLRVLMLDQISGEVDSTDVVAIN